MPANRRISGVSDYVGLSAYDHLGLWGFISVSAYINLLAYISLWAYMSVPGLCHIFTYGLISFLAYLDHVRILTLRLVLVCNLIQAFGRRSSYRFLWAYRLVRVFWLCKAVHSAHLARWHVKSMAHPLHICAPGVWQFQPLPCSTFLIQSVG